MVTMTTSNFRKINGTNSILLDWPTRRFIPLFFLSIPTTNEKLLAASSLTKTRLRIYTRFMRRLCCSKDT